MTDMQNIEELAESFNEMSTVEKWEEVKGLFNEDDILLLNEKIAEYYINENEAEAYELLANHIAKTQIEDAYDIARENFDIPWKYIEANQKEEEG